MILRNIIFHLYLSIILKLCKKKKIKKTIKIQIPKSKFNNYFYFLNYLKYIVFQIFFI